MKEPFDEWLANRIKEMGINQAEFARRAGVTRSGLGAILHGRRGPGVVMMTGISKALNIPVEDVMRAAGLSPSKKAKPDDPITKMINHLLPQLPRRDQEDILEMIEFKVKKREKNNESKISGGPGAGGA